MKWRGQRKVFGAVLNTPCALNSDGLHFHYDPRLFLLMRFAYKNSQLYGINV